MSLLRRLSHRIKSLAQQVDRVFDVLDRDVDRSSSVLLGRTPVEAIDFGRVEARLRLFAVGF